MKRFIAVSLLSLTLVACSGPVQPLPTATAIPTRTATAAPTLPPLPRSPTPDTRPASEWNGIPIMPGAIAGEGDEEGYVFTIKAPPQQVRDYYQLELGKLGWRTSSQSGDDLSLTLIFTSPASEMLTISIISKGEQALVLLGK